MIIKHTLASAKDKKATILDSEMSKILKDKKLNEVSLYYKDLKQYILYHKSRKGKTWYGKDQLIDKKYQPKIGIPTFLNVELKSQTDIFNNEFNLIREWALEKGILSKGDTKTQCIKLFEEAGELSKSILKNDEDEFIDAIGDCVVVLTNLAALKGYKIEDCINKAYCVISKRSGKMQNGTFVKNN